MPTPNDDPWVRHVLPNTFVVWKKRHSEQEASCSYSPRTKLECCPCDLPAKLYVWVGEVKVTAEFGDIQPICGARQEDMVCGLFLWHRDGFHNIAKDYETPGSWMPGQSWPVDPDA